MIRKLSIIIFLVIVAGLLSIVTIPVITTASGDFVTGDYIKTDLILIPVVELGEGFDYTAEQFDTWA